MPAACASSLDSWVPEQQPCSRWQAAGAQPGLLQAPPETLTSGRGAFCVRRRRRIFRDRAHVASPLSHSRPLHPPVEATPLLLTPLPRWAPLPVQQGPPQRPCSARSSSCWRWPSPATPPPTALPAGRAGAGWTTSATTCRCAGLGGAGRNGGRRIPIGAAHARVPRSAPPALNQHLHATSAAPQAWEDSQFWYYRFELSPKVGTFAFWDPVSTSCPGARAALEHPRPGRWLVVAHMRPLQPLVRTPAMPLPRSTRSRASP